MKSLLIIFCLPTLKYQDIEPFNPAMGKVLTSLRGWALDHIVKEEIKLIALSLNGKIRTLRFSMNISRHLELSLVSRYNRPSFHMCHTNFNHFSIWQKEKKKITLSDIKLEYIITWLEKEDGY